MQARPQTLIVSDLHLGGGRFDPGDDHVYQGGQLERFVRGRLASDEGQAGQIELFFNGDFLEFAQVNQQAYRSPSTDFWCSEAESVEKLESILCGHDKIMLALRDFQVQGNQVTIAAGNHDVDLCWPAVQTRLKQCIGDSLKFEIGAEWIERYDGKLQIGHGHVMDPANSFKHWAAPILDGPDGPRLEMCPGTLFMVRFVNGLEAAYPFADNLHPVQNLATVLLREDTGGFASAGWMLLKFAGRHPKTLSSESSSNIGKQHLQRLQDDDNFAEKLTAACTKLGGDWSAKGLRQKIINEEELAQLMMRLLGALPFSEWERLFAYRSPAVLGGGEKTLGMIAKARNFGRETLRDLARSRIDENPTAEVIVMGHTHLTDEKRFEHGHYLNPGSWTRYLDLEQHPNLKLEDLKDETRYPYALNYITVNCAGSGAPIDARLECFEKSK